MEFCDPKFEMGPGSKDVDLSPATCLCAGGRRSWRGRRGPKRGMLGTEILEMMHLSVMIKPMDNYEHG